MATKIHHIQPLAGVRDLYTLLEVLQNKDQFAAQLAQLEGTRKEINDRLEAVESVDEANHLQALARAKLADAEAVLTAANVKAEALKALTLEAIERDAQARVAAAAALVQQKSEFYTQREQSEAEFAARQTALERRETDLAGREMAAAAAHSHMEALRHEYETKLAKLKDISSALS